MSKEVNKLTCFIRDFNDFNYKPIAFCIDGCNKKVLKDSLSENLISHLNRMDDYTHYIAIWNCDLQTFDNLEDVYIDTFCDTYTLAQLFYHELTKSWAYTILDSERENPTA